MFLIGNRRRISYAVFCLKKRKTSQELLIHFVRSQTVEGLSDGLFEVGYVGIYVWEPHLQLGEVFPGCRICLGVGKAMVEASLEDVPDEVGIAFVWDLLNPLQHSASPFFDLGSLHKCQNEDNFLFG